MIKYTPLPSGVPSVIALGNSFRRRRIFDRISLLLSYNNMNLKSQTYLNKINEWTEQHKMQLNQAKTKAMIVNYTEKYQFTSRLELKGQNIEIV